MRFIPSYDEAVAICQRNPVFYETKHKVHGYDVSVFNYRLATYDDFRSENAFEMRGLTFVFNSDGTLYKRFLGLHKFFNVNETEITQAHDIKDYEVINVSEKLDGSLITFIELPNGEIVPKTKNAFDGGPVAYIGELVDDRLISFIREQFERACDEIGLNRKIFMKRFDNLSEQFGPALRTAAGKLTAEGFTGAEELAQRLMENKGEQK